MKKHFGPIKVKRKTGNEPFRHRGKKQNFKLNDFWSWSTSDLVINVTRGLVAEFIVAQALNAADGVRIAWAPFDLRTPKPERIKVEVKSAAYLQSWSQDNFSIIKFDIEKTTPLDNKKGGYRGKPRRVAKVYVFALLAEKDKSKVDPLNLDQWKFCVVPTATLNNRKRSQQSITLNSLKSEKEELKVQDVDFFGLKDAVKKAASIKAVS
ncbi:MAG: hypothetical protein ABSH11_12285 [Verrucomicrobiota bacterium]|jgi:hypothetical protein